MRRIVFTGGPGSGKSAVLQSLAAGGYNIGSDVPRSVIRNRRRLGLSPRPEPGVFARQVFDLEVEAYRSAPDTDTFFERGVIDALGALHGTGMMELEQALREAQTYPYEEVFIFPPWEQIYRTDAERDHSFAHAVEVYGSTLRWYELAGYTPIEVPQQSVSRRVEFVLHKLDVRSG